MASLNIPKSENTVRVRAFDCTTNMCVGSRGFIHPVLPGFENLNLTNMGFLVENEKLGKKVLFDCGARKDFENFSPVIRKRLDVLVVGLKIDKDVNEIVEEAGVPLESLNSMIWSHWHWDHHGAPEKYPKSVEVVVGPGFKEKFIPGYPTVPDGILLDANFEGREVREIAFSDSSFKIGKFLAHDLFGDGSFYLLDTPGHAIGHMCGLARTTPDTFIFMGGDICHFPGSFRPSTSFPLPDPVPSGQLDEEFPSPCPCSMFTHVHPAQPDEEKSKTSPFFEVTKHVQSAYLDRDVANRSIQGLQEFDESPDVLVCIAHDPALLKALPMLNDEPNEDINDWKAKGYKEAAQWGWLNELPRETQPGRPMLVDGVWREGEKIQSFRQAMGNAPAI